MNGIGIDFFCPVFITILLILFLWSISSSDELYLLIKSLFEINDKDIGICKLLKKKILLSNTIDFNVPLCLIFTKISKSSLILLLILSFSFLELGEIKLLFSSISVNNFSSKSLSFNSFSFLILILSLFILSFISFLIIKVEV